jgi:hypothetical protein
VPSNAHGDRKAGIARETDRRDHVRDASTTRDQRRAPIDGPVRDPLLAIVGRIGGRDDLTAEAAKLAQRDVGDSSGGHGRPQHCSSVNVVPQRPGAWSSASP